MDARNYFFKRFLANYKRARRMIFKNKFYKSRFYGYTFYQKRLLFSCPCHNMLRADHSMCKKYYTGQDYQKVNAYICAALSSISSILKQVCYKYLDSCTFNQESFNNYQLSNVLICTFSDLMSLIFFNCQ